MEYSKKLQDNCESRKNLWLWAFFSAESQLNYITKKWIYTHTIAHNEKWVDSQSRNPDSWNWVDSDSRNLDSRFIP